MPSTIPLVEGNTAPDVTVTLSHRTGVQDLTGATVAARITSKDGDDTPTLITCVVDNPPTAGRITVPSPSTGLAIGSYFIEYDVTYANTRIQTFPNKEEDRDTLLVRAS